MDFWTNLLLGWSVFVAGASLSCFAGLSLGWREDKLFFSVIFWPISCPFLIAGYFRENFGE